MRLHYLQHVPFESLGAIEDWITEHASPLTHTHFFANEPLPELDTFDGLIIMGGPMGVNDTQTYPWLAAEKKFIAASIAAGKKVLGICLGAQLIANALGCEVYPNAFKEIGWLPIHKTLAATDNSSNNLARLWPEETTVFHWHGDTFDLPIGAQLLASSEACFNQAFSIDQQILGLQFHLEMTSDGINDIIKHCGHEIKPAGFIQTSTEIKENRLYFESNRKLLNQLLSALFL